MREEILHYIEGMGLSPEIAVLLLATLPIFELRGAVPVGIILFELPVLKTAVFSVVGNMLPIIPILIGDEKLAVEFSKLLFEEGIFISAIRPPTVPHKTARLRFTVMATHTKSDLDYAIQKLKSVGKNLCLI